MKNFIIDFLDWSEVWAPLIPLAILWMYKPRQKWVKPLAIYLIITLLINFIIDFLYHPYLEHKILETNYVFYVLNSLTRVIFFSWFFSYLHPFLKKLSRAIPFLFLIAAALNFIFIGGINVFASKLMAFETALLLVYCISWFNIKIRDENAGPLFVENAAWVVVGISFYAAVNFVLFLFYQTLIESDSVFTYYMWYVHNISFTVMCILIAVAFKKNEPTRI